MRNASVAVAAATIAVALVPWAVWWSSLPDPVATHWSFGGDANGHLSPVVAVLVLGGVASVLAATALVAARSIVSSLPRVVAGGPILAFVGAVIAVASMSTVFANRDVTSWQSADLSPLWVVLSLVAGAGAGLVSANVQKVDGPPLDGASAPSAIPVSPTQRLAWVGTGRGRYNAALAIGLGVVGAVLVFVAPPPSGFILLLVAAIVGELSVVHVTISTKGVRVSAPFGLGWVHVALDRIARAEAIDVHPLQWGGWGYRGSLRLFRRAAWVVRSGPGLRLDLNDGRVFVVTIDDAEEAAAAVNGLLTSTPR